MTGQVSVKDIAWLAGLLEGEGSFVSRKENGDCRIALDMTDRDIVERAAALLGVTKVSERGLSATHKKRCFLIRVSGSKAAAWMMTLYTFMGERRRARIKEVLRLWMARQPKQSGWAARWGTARKCRNGKHDLVGRDKCEACYSVSAGIYSTQRLQR